MRRLPLPLALVVLLPGCATFGSLEGPDVLAPGTLDAGLDAEWTLPNDPGEVAEPYLFATRLRIALGLVPRVQGTFLLSPTGAGAHVKVRMPAEVVGLALIAGGGALGYEYCAFGGCADWSGTTLYGGLVVGTPSDDGPYASVRLVSTHFTDSADNCEDLNCGPARPRRYRSVGPVVGLGMAAGRHGWFRLEGTYHLVPAQRDFLGDGASGLSGLGFALRRRFGG